MYIFTMFSSSVEILLVNPKKGTRLKFNPLKSEFTIGIFIHYKPRIAVAILDL